MRFLLAVALAGAVLLGSVGLAWAADDPVSPAEVRAGVERSLPFLEKEGVAWMREKNCVSCHHVPFMLWSHNLARARGFAVDDRKVAEWSDWSWRFSQTRRAWFRLTKESLSNDAQGDLPAAIQSKLQGLVDQPFAAEEQLLAALGRVLTGEELERYRAALLRRASRPPEPENDGGGLDTLGQLLLGRGSSVPSAESAAFRDDLKDLMRRWQQPDGSWRAAGQLPRQNRPERETNEVSTMWAVLALVSLDRPGAAAEQSIQHAVEFLSRAQPGRSTEWLIGALLVQSKQGKAERAARLLRELQGRQNKDGGWAWLQGGGSDAFATGQALYALARTGQRADAPAIQRARRYLLQSQEQDGSWPVPSRAISPSTNEARQSRLAPIYRYWGTAWATIGLLETLPEARPTRRTVSRVSLPRM